MNIQKALDVLKDNMKFGSGIIEEAMKLVEQACRKQVPKTAKISVIESVYETRDYHCPVCGKTLIHFCDGDFYAGSKNRYCDCCGQALDWSEKEKNK